MLLLLQILAVTQSKRFPLWIMIPVSNVQEWRYNQRREYASWAFCSATKAVYENYKLQGGDILVTRTATLGITQYISNDISAVYNNGLIRLKVDRAKALPLYVYWGINTLDFMNYINQMNSATSVRPNMKIDYLLNYQMLIPPIEEQTQFARKAEAIRAAISFNSDEILKLVELQTTILATLSSRIINHLLPLEFNPIRDRNCMPSQCHAASR